MYGVGVKGYIPLWVNILHIAKEWGCPAWEITGEEPTNQVRFKWYQRFVSFNNAQAKAKEYKENHEKSKRY